MLHIQHHNCTHILLFKRTTMAMTRCCALILVEFMERCCVGFGRAESTGTSINFIGAIFIYSKVLLLGVGYASCDSQFDYNGNDAWLWIAFDLAWIYRPLSWWLWTSRKYVGIVACCNKHEGIIPRCSMLIIIAHSYSIRTHYNGWQWHVVVRWFWLNVWNGVVIRWLWTSRKYRYVNQYHSRSFELLEGVIVCLVLDMHHAIPNSTTIAMIHGSGFILTLLEYIDPCRGGCGRAASTLVLLHVATSMKVSFLDVWCFIYNIIITHSYSIRTHYNGNGTRLCVDFLNVWNGVVMALDE